MAATQIDTYLAALTGARAALPANDVPWVRAVREHGASRFAETGFPTTRDENWKYTNVAPLLRQTFVPALRDISADGAALARDSEIGEVAAHRLVFINGWYAPGLSTTGMPVGVKIGSLAQLLATSQAIETHLGQALPTEVRGFAALNIAFLGDGAFVHIAAGAAIEQPIHLVFIATGAADARLIQPRNLIVAERGAHASIVEHYVSAPDAAHLTNALTEIIAEADSRIEHYRVQQHGAKAGHIGGLHVRQARDSHLMSHAVDLGGLLVRHDLRSVLADTGAECVLNGLYVVDGRSHVDNHTEVDHAKPYGTSRECYKGVLGGRGRAVFNGRVVVRPDAQRTDAEQMNNNLLLSDDAEVDTKPELEIYADDVKCSHGATVGQLDDDALFYLRSRAVDAASARDLLTYAFAHDILSRMRLAPLRSKLERQLTQRLLAGRDIKEVELL